MTWRRLVRGGVLVALAVSAYFLVPVGDLDGHVLTRALATILTLGLLAAGVVWQVVLQVEDPHRRIDGLVLALVIAVLGFALAFYKLAFDDPGQLPGLETRLDGLYFTMTTLLTVGYGDIHAEGQVARGLVVVQMVFNVAVLATAATTLTSRVRQRAEERAEKRRQGEDESRRHARRTHRNPT